MGKVGSETFERSLVNARLPNPIYHIHFLSWKTIKAVENFYLKNAHVGLPEHLIRSQHLRRIIDQHGDKLRWNIITLVRDPVSSEISGVFQNIARDLPNYKAG